MPLTRELQQNDRTRGQLRDSVPCIDVRNIESGDADSIAMISDACRNIGFFFLDPSFDREDTIGRVLRQMGTFFSLDEADPRKQAVNVLETKSEQGWTPMFGELPYQPGTVAHMESFDCGRSPPPGSDETSNEWPELPEFRADVRACWDQLTAGRQRGSAGPGAGEWLAARSVCVPLQFPATQHNAPAALSAK